MTLASTVRQKLSEWRPETGRQDLTVTAQDGSLTLTADRREELGCLVWELGLQRAAPVGETLQSWADRVAQRVSGLLEPLKIVEIDAVRNEGILRSTQPQARDEQVLYNEVRLKGTREAVLRRYEAQGTDRRKQVAFALTHEAIAKLADDLAATK
jgi:hypothetical protein